MPQFTIEQHATIVKNMQCSERSLNHATDRHGQNMNVGFS
jgi:hypothetical protein